MPARVFPKLTPTGLKSIFPFASISRNTVPVRVFPKLTPTGLMRPPVLTVIYEVSRIWSGWGLFGGQKHVKKQAPSKSIWNSHWRPFRETPCQHEENSKTGKFFSPRTKGTPKREVMRGQKDLYILLNLVGPAPYIDLFRSQIQFVRRLFLHISFL